MAKTSKHPSKYALWRLFHGAMLALVGAILAMNLVGCANSSSNDGLSQTVAPSSQTSAKNESAPSDDSAPPANEDIDATDETIATAIDPTSIPAYEGHLVITVNGDVPAFSADELARETFEEYSPLDRLGRCGPAFALVGAETMPTDERESISSIKPTGWQTPNPQYDWVDAKNLYNRCHLLAFMLTGENANAQNLITGTRTLNTLGMLPLELDVHDYIEDTGNHVLMRVTPVFEGDNLLAKGVLMEAQSIEDGGAGLRFCRFCYNVEPRVVIDYATGESWAEEEPVTSEATKQDEEVHTYIFNKKSHKFHYPDCRGVSTMAEKNKLEFTGTRSEAIAQGYDPCGQCQP